MFRPKKACVLCGEPTDCYFPDVGIWCCWDCKLKATKIKKIKKIKKCREYPHKPKAEDSPPPNQITAFPTALYSE